MPIYTIAQYRVRSSGAEKVKRAIEEFVPYVQSKEPGTRMYEAWQQEDDPTRFVHFFIFEDEAAHAAHAKSDAVKRFEAAYGPELDGGNVVFTDYRLVATNKGAATDAGEILRQFYAAVVKRDLPGSRRFLKDDLLFKGLFETYRNADEYLAALTKLLQVTVRLEVKKIVADGDDAVVLFELETKAPVAATTLVAEWHQVKDGKIAGVQSVFDGRPFAAMFAPGQPDTVKVNRADIRHSIQIASNPETIYSLIATGHGFSQWWATDVKETGGAVELGFFNRATVYRLRLKVDKPPVEAEWICETGDEWNGTHITFRLESRPSGTLLHFTHGGWRSETDYFLNCNTTWGELMYRLKAAAEGKPRGPLFLAGDLAY